ncbi:single-stranded-DNA-specific exonuclease RecJ [Glaciecola siphonariae]|uniref:Single-stranded-DNA-specific exonuclease RecJ n=1 Tax=Glaciecola siphonariae TaxID=521012 RepID=A0ABV9M0G4_9ALTE
MLIKHRSPSSSEPLDDSLPPILDKILRQRGLKDAAEISTKAAHLLHYRALKDIDRAADIIASAIEESHNICIVGDFDADGATSTALCMLCLRDFGHSNAQFIVPNRFDFGYGLTPPVVNMAHEQGANVIVTVDNGISSVDGVALANSLGIKVVVTDHHLAGSHLPDASAIVNPNQPGCEFASKNIAGVGVAFYVMSAVKARLEQSEYFSAKGLCAPNLAKYLDIVALGTVADVVALDHNNRILVQQGIGRIRARKTRPGILALLDIGGRDPRRIASTDLGFVLGPRLNAAGRLQDMSVGIHCLLTNDNEQAYKIAAQLDALNRERRTIEQGMQNLAETALAAFEDDKNSMPAGIILYDEEYHQGVVGILAGRIKEKHYKPTIAFANENEHALKGSARSIPGVHIRDVLERIHTQNPGLIAKFGGHAMAAGLSLDKSKLPAFKQAFEEEVERVSAHLPNAHTMLSDGALACDEMVLQTAEILKMSIPWGQQFEEPLFDDDFTLINQRIVGEKHLKMVVQKDDQVFDAIAFNVDLERWPNLEVNRVHLAYRLDINEFRGQINVQLLVSGIEAVR